MAPSAPGAIGFWVCGRRFEEQQAAARAGGGGGGGGG
eukprot:SAG31_NODE_3404_length_4312_cov_3.365773_6_plen_36_part_01